MNSLIPWLFMTISKAIHDHILVLSYKIYNKIPFVHHFTEITYPFKKVHDHCMTFVILKKIPWPFQTWNVKKQLMTFPYCRNPVRNTGLVQLKFKTLPRMHCKFLLLNSGFIHSTNIWYYISNQNAFIHERPTFILNFVRVFWKISN